MPGTLDSNYTTSVWEPLIAGLAVAQHIPIPFVLSSIEEESAGQPCAIGKPGQTGTDGNPKELGILQLFNPDDLKMLGTTGAELRAYCVPGLHPVQVFNKKTQQYETVMSHSQRVARLLTADEMTRQAQLTIAKIASMRADAAHYASAAGVKWPSDSVDFWRLVKLVHGLPGLVHAIPKVATYLGHPPTSWAEYRHVIESGAVHCDANTEAYRADFPRLFTNAEKATSTMQQTGNVA